MSSKDSFQTLIFTPVAFWKASTIFMKATSSASTNRFHRSMLMLAPASGFQGAVCAQALAVPEASSALDTRAGRLTHPRSQALMERMVDQIVSLLGT